MTHEALLAREAIRDLVARCSTAGDRLRIEEFVACFTEDGVIESEHMPQDRAFCHRGHDAIRGWQGRWLLTEGAVHGATFVRHHLAASTIDLTGHHTAQARTCWSAWTDIGPDNAGLYLDDLCEDNGTWRIAHRRIRMDWEAGSVAVLWHKHPMRLEAGIAGAIGGHGRADRRQR